MCLKNFDSIQVGAATVFHGSNLDVLPFMADNSVDSIVCDPPYELGFMGKKWDSSGIAYSVELWSECLRVLKPGGHLLAFGGSRTWHRLAVAIEDAGFDVRDSIAWLYGSGFPKSLDISKAIDKAAGAEREAITETVIDIFGEREQVKELDNPAGNKAGGNSYNMSVAGMPESAAVTLPATAEAEKWDGWGTALKPAFEPIVVARKPLTGTVAENVLEWGVGGLNIDACRIASDDGFEKAWDKPVKTNISSGSQAFSPNTGTTHLVDLSLNKPVGGRWPANVVFDEYTAGLLDEQSEDVSRFFYVSKASKRDRNEGDVVNIHPTVKPTDLMRYLIKLVTPPNGIVLDPFTGSGSTGKAALLDGFQFIGIELTADYLPIIEGRLRWAEQERINQVSANEVKEKETLF